MWSRDRIYTCTIWWNRLKTMGTPTTRLLNVRTRPSRKYFWHVYCPPKEPFRSLLMISLLPSWQPMRHCRQLSNGCLISSTRLHASITLLIRKLSMLGNLIGKLKTNRFLFILSVDHCNRTNVQYPLLSSWISCAACWRAWLQPNMLFLFIRVIRCAGQCERLNRVAVYPGTKHFLLLLTNTSVYLTTSTQYMLVFMRMAHSPASTLCFT